MSLADLIANGVGVPSSLRTAIGYSIAASILLVAFFFPMPAVGQLGNNWVSATYTKKIHLGDESGLQTFNQVIPGTGADGNANGIVDEADYVLWQARYGSTLAASAGVTTTISAVPEPGMAISIAITTLSLFLVRFKSHRESSSNH